VLYGLLEYIRARGETTSAFPAEVFVNGAPVGLHNFTQAELTSPDPVIFSVPAHAGDNIVRIVKRGTGAVYWSATARYFDTRGPIEPTGSHKLALVRRYYSLLPVQKAGRIVYREAPFTGTAKPGDLLLVRLTLAGSTDWRYLVIEDPLPAAAEPIQQDSLYELEQQARVWYGSRREFRDDRAVFFQEDFTEGRYEYRYLLKVITPGSFRAMPAQIAPMYIPGFSASSGVQTVTVTAPPPR
jgi:alpha-2-macroglobulin